jgi:tetratricopeptide (TPR) repeat protein
VTLRQRPFEAGLAALLVAVAWLYAPALDFAFLSYDDPVYVTRNPHLAAGFSWQSVWWAFSEAHAGNWHPLTWLSHMADVAWFGVEPAGHHAVNVALHATNTALVFIALRKLTGRPGRSLAVAALFALHPLQIESVAWVSERKNLLSTSFGLLAITAYAGYAHHGGAGRMALVAGWMAVSLLSKAMWVTLPFLLLLLDVWPLARQAGLWERVREKWPLFALSIAASLAVYASQEDAGAMEPAADLAWLSRVAYVPLGYVGYLARVLWPVDLAVLYPHPLLAEGATLPWAEVALASALGLGLTGLALWAFRREHPALLIGWLWFVGMLVPVSGIVQIGWQGLADRYAYVPLIGLLLALVWVVADALDRWPRARVPIALAGTAALSLALASATHSQLGFWRSSQSLFERALSVTDPNPVMHNELGIALGAERRYPAAREQFEIAARLAPRWSVPLQNLGSLLRTLERPREALPYLERSLELAPDQIGTLVTLANALLDLDQPSEARIHIERARALAPKDPRTRLVAARLERTEAGRP